MRVLMIVALAMALTACASTPQKFTATKPELQARLDQETAQCRYEAEAGSLAAGGNSRSAIEVEYRKLQAKDDLFKLCMRAKGWSI